MTNWFDNIRIYHLLIDRFNGGWQVPPASKNVFCGGNLQGVIGKLDYIKGLGFNAIMLSPIFKSANYHGYHTLNFEDVDPHFGSWNDYQELLDKAHDMGLRIICDFVPNHCWYQAPVFEQSLLKNGAVAPEEWRQAPRLVLLSQGGQRRVCVVLRLWRPAEVQSYEP